MNLNVLQSYIYEIFASLEDLYSCLRQKCCVLHSPGRPPACEHWREYSEMVLQRQKESSFPLHAHLSCMQAWMYISRLRRNRQSANAGEVSNLSHSSRWGGRLTIFKRFVSTWASRHFLSCHKNCCLLNSNSYSRKNEETICPGRGKVFSAPHTVTLHSTRMSPCAHANKVHH